MFYNCCFLILQSELVEYYYLWKKTPGANNNRPHRRRRQGSLRRIRNTRNTRAGTPKEESGGTLPDPESPLSNHIQCACCLFNMEFVLTA